MGQERHTVLKCAVIVADALTKVEIMFLAIALAVDQGSAEDRDGTLALDGELDVLGRAGEVDAVPVKAS